MYEAVSASTSNGRAGSPLTFKPLTVILASLLATAVIATVGSLSEVSLGDENAHVRQARSYMRSGTRVPYDPDCSSVDDRIRYVFTANPLWHAGLALLWKAAGADSDWLAQTYQAGFYLLLVLSVYFGARQIWSEEAASWAWLLIATMPMVCAYSMLLYLDVPGIAVSALGLLLLWKKKFWWCGVALAAAYLTKANMLSYAPWAVVFAAWWARGTWKRRLTAAVLVAVPIALAFGYDRGWRLGAYEGLRPPQSENFLAGLSADAVASLKTKPENFVVWIPDPIGDPRILIMNIGIPALLAFCLAVVRAWDGIAKWIWAGFGLSLAGFVWVFALAQYPQTRYAFPVVVFLVLLGGRGLARWPLSSWLKVAIVAGCVLQAVAAGAYMYQRRQIPEWDRAGYAWIRENTSEHARVMYPEQILLNQTGRPWYWYGPYGTHGLAYFMTEATDAQRQELLRYFRVSHIAIPLRRIYDREREGDHCGGYPRDFVEKLDSKPYLKKVYENSGFRIYEFRSEE